MEEILLMALFFAPIVLASRGMACRRTWFELSGTFFLLSLASFVAAVAANLWLLDILGKQSVVKLLSYGTGLAGFPFLGCLLAGFFYREKRKSPSTASPGG